MPLLFSEFPGRRERHLLRRRNNPLFPAQLRAPSEAQLQEAQRLDHEELVDFIGRFHTLVNAAARLQPNAGSEVILDLKERLDRSYEEACGMADEQGERKQAIIRLLEIIMRAVRAGAANDPIALAELEQESQARVAHFQLLEHPLVADLLCPETPIPPEDLVPTLLSADAVALEAALELFEDEAIGEIYAEGEALLAANEDIRAAAGQRLAQIGARIRGASPTLSH